MNRIAKRIGALLFGLLLIELTLQGLAWLGRATREPRFAEFADAELVILCVGDSHVYGFNVDAPAAWPAQLEDRLREAGLDARVVNRGLPGKHSRVVLDELPTYLDEYQPDLVLCKVGINNRHSAISERQDEAPPWWTKLRTARLLAIAFSRVSTEDVPVRREISGEEAEGVGEELEIVELGDGRREVRMRTREGLVEVFEIGGGVVEENQEAIEDALTILMQDLVSIGRMTEEAGAQTVLLTYADGHDEGLLLMPNLAIRRAHMEHELPLIDLAEIMQPMHAEVGKERLLFADAHPRREGHALIGRIVADALGAQELVPGAPRDADPLAPLRSSGPAEARLESLEGAVGALASYEPGLEFDLLLSTSTGEGFRLREHHVRLERDALFEAAQAASALHGPFGADGSARIELPAELLELAGEAPIWGVLVARTPGHAWLQVTEPVQLR